MLIINQFCCLLKVIIDDDNNHRVEIPDQNADEVKYERRVEEESSKVKNTSYDAVDKAKANEHFLRKCSKLSMASGFRISLSK